MAMPKGTVFRKHETYQPNPNRAMRKCMTCRREFLSEWIGNRICERCKERELFSVDTAEQMRERI